MGMQKSKQNKLLTLDQQIAEEVATPLKSLEDEQIKNTTILAQLAALNTALSGRTRFSQLLSDLKANQYKKSLWSDFSVQNSTISISGKVDSYQDVAKAVAAMRNIKAVTDVKLSSASADKESAKVTFMVTITYDPSLYKVTQTEPPASLTPAT
jgi:Tfp pilus assembly protein PilN